MGAWGQAGAWGSGAAAAGSGNGRVLPDSHDLVVWYNPGSTTTWANAGTGAHLDLTFHGAAPGLYGGLGPFGDALLAPAALGAGAGGTVGITPTDQGNPPGEGSTITASAWLFFPAASGDPTAQGIMVKEYAPGSWTAPYLTWWLALTGDGHLQADCTLLGGSQPTVASSAPLAAGQLHHVGLVLVGGSSGSLTLYADGAQVGQASFSGTLDYASHGPYAVAGIPDVAGSTHSPGWVDDVRLASVARDASWFSAVWATRRTP